MGPLFSKKKTIELKAEDQAILKCKMCRDNIKRYIKRLENDANFEKTESKRSFTSKE